MKLYCARHGEACSADVDPERSLTEQGRIDIMRMARYLSGCGIQVDHVLHSKKARAVQTANILAETLCTQSSTTSTSLLAEQADPLALSAMLPTWTEDTLLVGHLPLLSDLVNHLVGGDARAYPIVHYSPGTIVCLQYYQGQHWMIDWLLSPAMVPNQFS